MNFEEFLDYSLHLTPTDLSDNPHGFRGNEEAVKFLENLPETHRDRYYQNRLQEMKGRAESGQVAHLPLLMFFARQCNHVTEFGMREGFSSAALASSVRSKLVSYDICITGGVNLFRSFTKLPCKWEFVQADVTDPFLVIEPTDLLYIDDLHTERQVRTELLQHYDRVRKWIAFHDTYSQGERSLDVPGEPGIRNAIVNFCQKYNWKKIYECKFNHGFTVIERIYV
jgi:hypothetical protein